jgi:hypothetical protein
VLLWHPQTSVMDGLYHDAVKILSVFPLTD